MARRRACCPRRALPAGRARSDTRRTGSRAASGSETLRRRQSRRTTAPAEIVYASCVRLHDWHQGSICAHFVAPAAPADDVDKVARHIDCKGQQIARGTEPPTARADPQSMINLPLQDKAAGERGDDAADADRTEAA